MSTIIVGRRAISNQRSRIAYTYCIHVNQDGLQINRAGARAGARARFLARGLKFTFRARARTRARFLARGLKLTFRARTRARFLARGLKLTFRATAYILKAYLRRIRLPCSHLGSW
jgi:hypothetical protein